MAIVNSLTWTGHAVDNPKYFLNSLLYLKQGKNKNLELATDHNGRYGKDKLENVLRSWKVILDQIGHTNLRTIRPEKLMLFQENIWYVTNRLNSNNLVKGIGNWLLFAPIKIILCYRKPLWNNEYFDKLIMPIGFEVLKGIKKLVRRNTKYTIGYEINMFDEEEGGLVEGRGAMELVHSICYNISKDFGKRIVHINSGLHQFGSGNI